MSEDGEVAITADFFANILETDLANIVKKASSGQPLNKREREMIAEERTRLQKSPQPAFTLEGGGTTCALDRMTQAELADEYGLSLRTVKGWIADGRTANDPVPFSKPGEMVAWFERMHPGRNASEKLQLAVQRILAGDKARDQTKDPPPANALAIPVMVIAEEQKGLLAMLERHRTAEATLHAQYMAAVAAGNEQRAAFLMKEWKAMGENLRALEKAAPKALEEMGIYVRKDEVMRELEPLHRSIPKSFRQRLRLARVRLLALAQLGPEEWNREIDAIVEDVCSVLVDSEFREPLELEAA